MRDYSGNNRRYYPMRRVENRPGGAINLDKNNVNNLRMLASNKYGGRDIRLYQTNPTIFRKIGNRSGPKNLLNEFEFFNERKIYNTPIRQDAKYHRKNYYSKGFDYINNSPINNELSLDKSYTTLRNFRRINPNQNNYRNYLQSYNYSPDYVIPNYRKTEYNSSYSKYNYNRNRISPRKSPNIITNRFWLNNYYGIKKIPAVVVTKKNDRRTSPYNTIIKRKKIVKIQSAWRGYFLRKIAVGSIKKYIGFIALVKYLDKIYINNIQYIFEEFISSLKNFNGEKKAQYIYQKLNNNDNNIKKVRGQNYELSRETNYYKNKEIPKLIKNQNFNNNEFDTSRDKSANYRTERGLRQSSNKKSNIGVTVFFVDKDKLETERKETLSTKKNITPLRYKKNAINKLSLKNTQSPDKKKVYIPKKISAYKSFKGKYNKFSNQKLKIEKFIKLIKKKYYGQYYPTIKYKLKK